MRPWMTPLLLALTAAPALAADPAPATSEEAARAAVREELVRTELELARKLAEAVEVGLDAGVEIGPEARASWEKAKILHKDAVALHDEGKDARAYATAREAVVALESPAIALYGYEPVPAGMPEAAGRQMEIVKERMEALEPLIGPHASADVKAQWEVTETAYHTAKDLWTGGDRREGYRKSWATLRELDATLRLLFPEAERATKRGR